MSTKEATRGTVFAQVVAGRLPLVAAARQLAVSYRQAKRLVARYKAQGRVGLRHGNVGRRSNRAWPAAEQETVLALLRTHYSGPPSGAGQRFGPTLAAEHLWTDHGHLIPVPTLRRWMLGAGLWSRQRRARPVHVRRARRVAFGELLQLDGSFHDWFEGRGDLPRPPCLMSLVDDATGTMLGRFGAEETTWAAVGVLRAWIERYGVPQALYTDAKTVYTRHATSAELATGRPPRTQFGRMCDRLGIQLIIARSPEAKGRIERNHGTSQDRLIKKMRLAGITSTEAANAFLASSYLADHNRRFAVAAASGADGHTPLRPTMALSEVFCLEESRRLGNDWVIRYQNAGLQVTPTRAAKRHVAPGRQVLVRESEDGTRRLVVCSPTGREHVLAWTAIAVTSTSGRFVPPPTAAAAPQPEAPPTPTPTPTPAPTPAPAGFTRSGKPLSERQMAMRAQWSRQVTAETNRREGLHRVNEARRARGSTPATVGTDG